MRYASNTVADGALQLWFQHCTHAQNIFTMTFRVIVELTKFSTVFL